jgi:acyl-CoA thioesterase-1
MRVASRLPPCFAALALALAACGGADPTEPEAPSSPAVAESSTAAAVADPEPESPGGPLVVFLGDSLTAGLGVSQEEAFPALVGRRLADRGLPVRVVNGGISGDTSAGGLERLDWYLDRRPDLVVVELGANDGLRGQPLAATEASLRAIVERSLAAGARVVLAGMKLPPNYGPEYARGFETLYRELARDYPVVFLPFLLEGVAAEPELNQPDGIHPNARGHQVVARTVAETLAPVVAELSAAR